ncbi:hypothetical protein P5808_28635 [Bacillus cereus]|uniref:hypothetical protein n=1 Tax=Bacillus cereus group TaxID=86661 RepID=UPI001F585ADD|nr:MULTISPECIES: hypothetical protein [Bacillus cereus group]MDF9505892.1 hypothetical protein [Bacillus cereus]MDF9597882.1 hypothetical protein [Bacillus cereus]MDF9610021.1 hypothetical protein [Bacillus cereus]MDF9661039.1 hypothetical protein [Bacillus cereus]
MGATTRWIDDTGNSLDQIIEKLLADTEEKRFEDKTSYINVQVNKVFETNQTIILNNKTITYNLINYVYDSVYPGDSPIEERKTPISGSVIVYLNGDKVGYIVDKNYNALTELRWLIGYKGRLEILKNESSIHSELLIWIISRIFKEENELILSLSEENEIKLILNSIVGFKGQTDDQVSFVSADGDSILNILSTLSFLLESKLLQQIKLRLQFEDHENVELVLKDNKTIAVNINKYDGPFDDYGNKYKRYSELYLLIYLDIMPMLYSNYQQDLDNELWGTPQKKEFLTSVRDKLIQKINEKVESI